MGLRFSRDRCGDFRWERGELVATGMEGGGCMKAYEIVLRDVCGAGCVFVFFFLLN